jgi:hypothetical protein
MLNVLFHRAGCLGLFAVLFLLFMTSEPARAVPSFAAQTGQPCSACHVGGFGPQLTPLGRAFKIGGYTQIGGEGPLSHIPLAAMAIGSFTHTSTAQPNAAAPDFGRNNNVALDQVSVFFAGRLNDYMGAFVQGTYDGVGHAFAGQRRPAPDGALGSQGHPICASACRSTTARPSRTPTTQPLPGSFRLPVPRWRRRLPLSHCLPAD